MLLEDDYCHQSKVNQSLSCIFSAVIYFRV